MQSDDTGHPEEERPRMDVTVIDSSVSASAEAITRPVVGEDEPQLKGRVSVRTVIDIHCPCGKTVTLDSIQSAVTCQRCGRRWEQ